MPIKYLLECSEIAYHKIILITKFTDNKRNMYIVQTSCYVYVEVCYAAVSYIARVTTMIGP